MMIKSATIIYFSPTRTTKKIIDSIVKGMKLEKINLVDLTLPKVRDTIPLEINDDIVVIGVPVYENRVPEMLLEFLNNLKGNNKPTVLICVYGNNTYGIALNELFRISESSNLKVIGAGTFIGEHSFSTEKLPLAKGRPNYEDLSKAEIFGTEIIEKLSKKEEIGDIQLKIPKGKVQLMYNILSEHTTKMFMKQPMVDKNICNDCGSCAYFCPMGAINKDTLDINEDKCIRCFSCVKRCSRKARKIIYKKKFLVDNVLKFKSRVKKEVQTYL